MNDYKQDVRDLIFKRESEGKPIHEIAEEIEKIIREQLAQKIEAHAQKVLKAGENIMYFDGFIDSAAIARGNSK